MQRNYMNSNDVFPILDLIRRERQKVRPIFRGAGGDGGGNTTIIYGDTIINNGDTGGTGGTGGIGGSGGTGGIGGIGGTGGTGGAGGTGGTGGTGGAGGTDGKDGSIDTVVTPIEEWRVVALYVTRDTENPVNKRAIKQLDIEYENGATAVVYMYRGADPAVTNRGRDNDYINHVMIRQVKMITTFEDLEETMLVNVHKTDDYTAITGVTIEYIGTLGEPVEQEGPDEQEPTGQTGGATQPGQPGQPGEEGKPGEEGQAGGTGGTGEQGNDGETGEEGQTGGTGEPNETGEPSGTGEPSEPDETTPEDTEEPPSETPVESVDSGVDEEYDDLPTYEPPVLDNSNFYGNREKDDEVIL